MKSRTAKSLIFVVLVVFFRSIYLHQEFYKNIWEENMFTVIFLFSLFALGIIAVIRFGKTALTGEEVD
ncbi:hypothetical protein MKO06_00720 [Gramella sp. GC03-9]|uniref:Uncharacterized protein n=1 Tax=Christiangramia oceanisediminis TaxID=2920386 RepID=A0A9X2I732_9FLAO|nr:hypothetical protein [Gramella oceanisediminis]MCP9198412.1 hypothetical protein [Gramella oceanisediminis]